MPLPPPKASPKQTAATAKKSQETETKPPPATTTTYQSPRKERVDTNILKLRGPAGEAVRPMNPQLPLSPCPARAAIHKILKYKPNEAEKQEAAPTKKAP